MDFSFTAEDQAWRDEVRAFLVAELPGDWAKRAGGGRGEDPETRAFRKAFGQKLAAKGWVAIAWPREYGGLSASYLQQLIYTEEMGLARAPAPGGLGVVTAGPGIILYGSEAQKQQHLGGITRAETVWCVGFSEPNAGSDLASLQTRAVQDGDDWVVNGTKIWTTQGHQADWCYLAARTDPDLPQHRGISVLLVDMKSAGITVRPIRNMTGQHEFNQLFFEDVRVPRQNLLGEQNRGWYQIAASLDFERSNIYANVESRHMLEDYLAYARQTRRNGRALAKDPLIRRRFADLLCEVEVGRLLSYKVVSLQQAGKIPNKEASAAKLWHSEVAQRVAALGMLLAGPYAPLTGQNAWAPLRGEIPYQSLYTVSLTIAAGTSEINRGIIATRGLGLPR
jgi:alkylation response protein AidB-like acyl-CoA dehydrogenase